jgi:5-methylthioadenosine/S-adenosylhomocysteine deaminase
MAMVGGRILMEDYRVLSVDETEILERVEAAAERTFERSGLRHLLDMPATLWRNSRY